MNVVLPVFLITAAGYIFGKKRKINLSAINDFVIYLATPALIISSLSEDPIDLAIAGKVFLSVCIVIGVSLVLWLVVIRAMKLHVKVYLPPVLFANTGNMGLPLVLFAFGEAGFSVAILYMVSTTVIHYTLGIYILSYDESPFEVLRLPLVYSAVAGVLLSVSGWELPVAIFRSLDLLGEASIPAMIFALGCKLSEVAIKDVGKSFMAGGMRILFGIILGVLSVRILHLEGVEASVVILLAAMPPAVFNFVLADRYNQDSETVASIILAGTLISAVTTPVIIAFLLN
ncbi:MAG TPA: AEC family transporter [Thermodesulfobacteriota bacterium]|nr:AEC family transporter [Thermodesulfobacteriota bacterium]